MAARDSRRLGYPHRPGGLKSAPARVRMKARVRSPPPPPAAAGCSVDRNPMAASNTSWGIEVGAGAIKALKLVARGDTFEVAEFAVVPHKKVRSTPDLDQDEAVRMALGALANHYDLSKATVVMSVPGHSAFARFAKLPPVEPKKVPQIVRFEAQQQIPFPLEEVEWDYQTFRSPNSPDVEAGIFAITKQRINERLGVWQDVGITPDV